MEKKNEIARAGARRIRGVGDGMPTYEEQSGSSLLLYSVNNMAGWDFNGGFGAADSLRETLRSTSSPTRDNNIRQKIFLFFFLCFRIESSQTKKDR